MLEQNMEDETSIDAGNKKSPSSMPVRGPRFAGSAAVRHVPTDATVVPAEPTHRTSPLSGVADAVKEKRPPTIARKAETSPLPGMGEVVTEEKPLSDVGHKAPKADNSAPHSLKEELSGNSPAQRSSKKTHVDRIEAKTENSDTPAFSIESRRVFDGVPPVLPSEKRCFLPKNPLSTDATAPSTAPRPRETRAPSQPQWRGPLRKASATIASGPRPRHKSAVDSAPSVLETPLLSDSDKNISAQAADEELPPLVTVPLPPPRPQYTPTFTFQGHETVKMPSEVLSCVQTESGGNGPPPSARHLHDAASDSEIALQPLVTVPLPPPSPLYSSVPTLPEHESVKNPSEVLSCVQAELAGSGPLPSAQPLQDTVCDSEIELQPLITVPLPPPGPPCSSVACSSHIDSASPIPIPLSLSQKTHEPPKNVSQIPRDTVPVPHSVSGETPVMPHVLPKRLVDEQAAQLPRPLPRADHTQFGNRSTSGRSAPPHYDDTPSTRESPHGSLGPKSTSEVRASSTHTPNTPPRRSNDDLNAPNSSQLDLGVFLHYFSLLPARHHVVDVAR